MHYSWNKTPEGKKAWISAIVAGGTTLISIFLGIPYLRHRVARDMEREEEEQAG